MRNKEPTATKIRQSYNSLLFISLMGILMGLSYVILVLFDPTPKYENLLVENVVVDTFGYHAKYRGGGYYYIDTTDDTRYVLNGHFSSAELYDYLLSDTEISIKWYRHRNGTNYVKEIKHGQSLLSSYYNNDLLDAVIGCVIGGLVCSLGIGGLILRYRIIKKEIATALKKQISTI